MIDFGTGPRGDIGIGGQKVQGEGDGVGGGFAADDEQCQDLVDDVVVVKVLAGVGIGRVEDDVEQVLARAWCRVPAPSPMMSATCRCISVLSVLC